MWRLSSLSYAVRKWQVQLRGLGGKLACEWWAVTCKQWKTKFQQEVVVSISKMQYSWFVHVRYNIPRRL